jgi:Glyoxalase-like domain
MTRSLLAIVVDSQDACSQADWWAAVLDHRTTERNPDEYEVSDESGNGTPLYFMNVPEPKTVKDRLHLDITTDEPLEVAVQHLTAVGATLVATHRDPPTHPNPDTWAVMHDPEGNEFCVFNVHTVSGMT